jgi:tetratricopeptide (TPR) repeat protein
MSTTGESASGFDLFLSHASADKAWVRRLKAELEQEGLRVFLDERELEPGDIWVDELGEGLRLSRSLVLVLTHESAGRPWVAKEWKVFLSKHGPERRIFPVILEPVELPTMLADVQALDAKDRDPARVARELARLIGRPNELSKGDTRLLLIGQNLVFDLEWAGENLVINDPSGRRREVAPPWRQDNRFGVAALGFRTLTRQAIGSDAERVELVSHATVLGKALFSLLFDAEGADRLHRAGIEGRPRPLITLRSGDDALLALPWELLRHDGEFLVREGRVDIARSIPTDPALEGSLRPPAGPFTLVVNVSAPEGSGLDYEGESYRITRALSEHCILTPTELGTLDDLIATVAKARPTGLHFSGHGAPGELVFEDGEGRADRVPIAELVRRLRTGVPGGLPPFFYLASCHGNDPRASGREDETAESLAARLHREGVCQVVGYAGPIVDELSTRAEETLYAAIAEGHPTRWAVLRAREALARPLGEAQAVHREPAAAVARNTHPFAWAQLVFYHRGPDHPLGLPVPSDGRRLAGDVLQRTFLDGGTRRILATGFIGRRSELHRIRKRIRRGDRVFVLQGLGGVGKTTLAIQMLPLLCPPEGRLTLWCQDAEKRREDYDPIAGALVGQLLEDCRRRFGLEWEQVVQQVNRVAGDAAAQQFASFLGALLQNVPRLVVYLDNMESLLVGPDESRGTADEAAFGTWRSPALAAIWSTLARTARDGGKLHVVASCRYRHADFGKALMPVSPLPDDALFRLMNWFPGLRRLSVPVRARLVARLAGHPRAVEFANDLVEHALDQWEDHRGEWRLPAVPGPGDQTREWDQLVEPALPQVQQRLRDDLLFDALWDRVLDEPARRMLYRMTLLLRPWDWDLMKELGEPDAPPAVAEATAERLRRTSLLEQVDLFEQIREGEFGIVRRYTLHPATAQFVTQRFGIDEELRLASHRRVGTYLEAWVKTAPIIEIRVDAGYHLFQAGEYDRANELLGSASQWLQVRGRFREGLRILEPFLAEPVRHAMRPALVSRLLGTVGNAYADLGQVEKAIGYHEQRLVFDREIGNRQGEGNALGDLGVAYADLGQVEKAIGCYEQSMVIAREIGDRRGEGAALGNLGLAYADLGQVEKAIGYHEQALVIKREIGDRRGEGHDLGNLGIAYAGSGQVEKAIGYHEQALVIHREIGDRQGEGHDLGNLGIAYSASGREEKAIGYFEKHLVIGRVTGDRRSEGIALGNLGIAYATLGQVEKALGLLEQAVRIGREIRDPRIVQPFSALLEWLRGAGTA